MTLCLLFTLNSAYAVNTGSEAKQAIVATQPAQNEEIEAMLNRLEEIKAMDIASMTKIQKKELRKEVRAIKQELRAVSGIYISIGALIIIILLLILIL